MIFKQCQITYGNDWNQHAKIAGTRAGLLRAGCIVIGPFAFQTDLHE